MDNYAKFLRCLEIYPVMEAILEHTTSLETLRALTVLAKENLSGLCQKSILRLIRRQESHFRVELGTYMKCH